MELFINKRKVIVEQSQEEAIRHRVAFCFSRLDDIVQSVTLTIKDVNGPRGGNDKECKVLVKFYRQTELVITERQADLVHATHRALQRASHSALRKSKRNASRQYRSMAI